MQDFLWIDTGPKVTLVDVLDFQRMTGWNLPAEFAFFLIEVANGGMTDPEVAFVIESMEGEFATLHGLLGLNHPKPYFDLGRRLESVGSHLQGKVFPVGYDEIDSLIVVKTGLLPVSEVCYWDWASSDLPVEENLHRIAESFDVFIESLQILE